MAAARKTPRRTTTAKSGAKHKDAKRQLVKVTLPPATPAPSTGLSPEPPGFLIVGIGASAGGLEAMEDFFRHMSPSSGMAFVVVSHQHAGHVSLLPSLLSKCTAMPVVEATDGMEVEANCVYLAPGGAKLAILHGTLHLMEPDSQERVPLPIDYFFRSLAEDRKQGAVGIILSGTGTDGTVGLRAIKAESGMTIAQDPQSAKYQGMPRSAIAAGVVDVVQPADQMSEPLRGYALSLTKPAPLLPERDASQTLHKIFILLRDRTGLPVTFTAREVPGTLSPEIATNLFRVMQESLQNVSKHAQATDVTVRLSGSSKGIGLSVRDNGKGFDLESKHARVKGIGLVSMQERARLLGGFFRIHCGSENGTKVCA